ncbi:hypothetical protein JIN85_07855 [Luteolibacter pohnpeiensis]|uniref:Lipoprotein n=1 Tax=Luteolibacter pohnpeiensis TaxID=454153 RepID=A0A934SAH8_9BACT|nr:hypothetical protein [Luteolibacter pohnpeiensis]MBK1882324.1 hypothetical protein [Luteolibacter pohnpeiensis]
MKNLFYLTTLIAVSLGFSSCCSMFSLHKASYVTETKQVKLCGYDTVTEQVAVGDPKDGMVQTVEKKVPRYKTVTKKVRVKCGPCTHFYCPTTGCCGTTSEEFLNMVTAQPATGSPFIGLVPTMKTLAP